MTSVSFPLKIGTDQQFSGLRDSLHEAGFTESAVCERTGIETIYQFKTLLEKRAERAEFSDALEVLIRLVMDGVSIREELILRHISSETLAVLESLGVVERDPEDPAVCTSSAFLYPVAGLYIASDRTFPAKHGDRTLPEDVVYAAITGNSGRFLSILPQEPCGDLLDLCTGTGVAAIFAASRYARHAWATDLGPRCVHFAEFNQRLNGVPNMTCAQGDLYDAVGDLTFDRISAHPPYIPAKDRKLLFRDGGEDGEQILRRIVQGLPRHLRPNGRFYGLSFATDRQNSLVEQRLRDWLGEAQTEFDVSLIENEFQTRPDGLMTALQKAKGRRGSLGYTAQLFEELKVTGLFYGTFVVHRKTGNRPAATSRIRKTEDAASEAVEWFWRWNAAAAEPDFPELLLRSRPVTAPRFKLQVTHTRQAEGLLPSEFLLRTDYPFVSEASVEPWVAVVAGHCDGQHTTREIFAAMKDQEVIAAEMSEREFASLFQLLLSSGFLEIEGWRLPVPTASELH